MRLSISHNLGAADRLCKWPQVTDDARCFAVVDQAMQRLSA